MRFILCGLFIFFTACEDVKSIATRNGVRVGEGLAFTSSSEDVSAETHSLKDGERYIQIATKRGHTCALKANGAAYCWGSNSYGELGNNSANPVQLEPVAVTGSHRFTSIAVGGNITCGITTDQDAYCWGANHYGMLGNGNSIHQRAPVLVAGGHKFIQLSIGNQHTCGLTIEKIAYCWGISWGGSLGGGSKQEKTEVPVAVAGSRKYRSISAHEITCAVGEDGLAYCWGHISWKDFNAATAIPGAKNLIFIEPGYPSNIALSSDGTVSWWGDEMHDFSIYTTHYPFAPIAGSQKFKMISQGWKTCGLDASGTAYCWESAGTPAPVPVTYSRRFIWISAGDGAYCGIDTAGDAYCWGSNAEGALGNTSLP